MDVKCQIRNICNPAGRQRCPERDHRSVDAGSGPRWD